MTSQSKRDTINEQTFFSYCIRFHQKKIVKRQVPVNKTPTLGLDPGHDFQNSVINLHVPKPMPVEKNRNFFLSI